MDKVSKICFFNLFILLYLNKSPVCTNDAASVHQRFVVSNPQETNETHQMKTGDESYAYGCIFNKNKSVKIKQNTIFLL